MTKKFPKQIHVYWESFENDDDLLAVDQDKVPEDFRDGEIVGVYELVKRLKVTKTAEWKELRP